MNPNRISALALPFLLMLAGCGGAASVPAEPPLAGASIGGPFALTDPHGRIVRDTDFRGKYRIVYFGYTFCPDVCPTDLQNIGMAMRQLDQDDPALAAKIVPIFITVDPERDTPDIAGRFAAGFSPRIVALVPKPGEVAALTKAYGIYAAKEKANAEGGYLVTHSNQAYLMDPDGKPLALLPADQSGTAIVTELERWAK